jgi:hypothetical protein
VWNVLCCELSQPAHHLRTSQFWYSIPPFDLHPHLSKHTPAHENQDVEEEKLCLVSLYSLLRSHSNSLSAFQSDLVTILVGSNEEKFTVHQDVVTKARYFAGCLDSVLQERHTKIINLPEDEPAVIAKVLEHLYSGKIEVATFKADIRSEEERLQFVLLAKMYIAADKFCMGALHNMLMDVVKQTLIEKLADASAIHVLLDAGLGESPTALFVIRSLARTLCKLGCEKVLEIDERLRELINDPAPFADELLRTCITFGTTTESDFLPHPSNFVWHIHSDGRKYGAGTV